MTHVTDRLAAYLADELDPATLRAVDEHLAGCADCAAELAESRRSWDLLAAARIELPQASGAWDAVRGRTTARPAWFFGSGTWTRRGWATAAVAAGLMLGVVAPALLVPRTADAESTDPVLAGTSWNDDATGDLADWWLETAAAEEDTP